MIANEHEKRPCLLALTHILHAKIYDAADEGLNSATETAQEELRVVSISVAQPEVAAELNALFKVGRRCALLRRYQTFRNIDGWRWQTIRRVFGGRPFIDLLSCPYPITAYRLAVYSGVLYAIPATARDYTFREFDTGGLAPRSSC